MTQHLHLVAFLWQHRQGVWRANSETGLNDRFYCLKPGSWSRRWNPLTKIN